MTDAPARRGQWLVDQKRHDERPLAPASQPVSAEEAARFIVPHVLSGCAGGELSFADAVACCAAAVHVDGMPDAKRQKLLGAAVEALLSIPPKTTRTRQRERPLWLCRACAELVEMVTVREGLPLVGGAVGGPTAYQRVAEILNERGITGMSAASVTKARADWKLYTHKP
ncbi:MAG: hypothetical protein ABI702_08370 [Burkholderiales bacterium]